MGIQRCEHGHHSLAKLTACCRYLLFICNKSRSSQGITIWAVQARSFRIVPGYSGLTSFRIRAHPRQEILIPLPEIPDLAATVCVKCTCQTHYKGLQLFQGLNKDLPAGLGCQLTKTQGMLHSGPKICQ